MIWKRRLLSSLDRDAIRYLAQLAKNFVKKGIFLIIVFKKSLKNMTNVGLHPFISLCGIIYLFKPAVFTFSCKVHLPKTNRQALTNRN